MKRELVFPSLWGYQRSWLRPDLLAALSVWAVLTPEALAYATIAGVSPVVGLYAAPAALVLYAAFGSSRLLIAGPMSSTAALSAAVVADSLVDSGDFAAMTAAVAIITGAVAMAAAIVRLGFIANFVSEPVLKGFIIGLSIEIIVGQLPKLLGIEPVEGNVFEELRGVFRELNESSGWTVAVAGASLGLLLGMRRFTPSLPSSLIAVAAGIVSVLAFDLDDHGVAIVGDVERGLPSLGWPDLALDRFEDLVPGAVGLLFVGFAEALGAAKTSAAKQHQDIDANRELFALGAGNIGAGLMSGMVVGGSLSKTAVNTDAGAKSQLSSLFVAALVLVTLLFLLGVFEDLPQAILGAIVTVVMAEMVDIGALRRLYRTTSSPRASAFGIASRPDFAAAVATLAGVLVFGTLPGLFLGIVISGALLVYRATTPHIALLGRQPANPHRFEDMARHPEVAEVPGLVILRIEQSLFFANADTVRDRIRKEARRPGITAVLIDAETMPSVDVTAAQMLMELASDLHRFGIQLAMARGVDAVRDVLTSTGANIRIYPSVSEAVEALAGPQGR